MPKVTLVCATCGAKARRELLEEVASRGVHEAPSEPATCPRGHGLMKREDGRRSGFTPCTVVRSDDKRFHRLLERKSK